MTGYILLEGGAEFGGRMAEPDRRAMELAGGPQARISIIPAAAAPDNNQQRAGRNGERWFSGLGARRVAALPLVDRASANDPAIAAALRDSRLIYLLGGFTHYLGQTLADSAAWEAILAAYREGTVVAGSSAGAMVLCEHYYDPGGARVVAGLGLLSRACVLPHHNTFGQNWAPRLAGLLPDDLLLGIDERTGILDDGPAHLWTVHGQGTVTVYRGSQRAVIRSGESFSLEGTQR